MPYCKKCGNKLGTDAAFCPECGTPNPLYKEELSSESDDMNKPDEPKTIRRERFSYGTDLQNLPVGFIVDERYEVKEKIGEGGFGTVYEVWDRDIESAKAIKVINSTYYSDKEVIADLKREAKHLMQVDSGNVVKFYDIHLKGSIKYIDMEYINGGDLVDLKLKYKESGKGVPGDKVLEIAKQICNGMQAIHTKNVIHKDIKPQNIMLMKDGTVKIMDFGIAETFRTSKSRIHESKRSGTPAYMSPEQILGENVGKESDVWSFGVMLYELLSGTTLYTGQTTNEILLQIERKKFKPIENISERMNNLLKKCLKYDYHERFRDFVEIQKYLTGEIKEGVSPIVKEKTEERIDYSPLRVENRKEEERGIKRKKEIGKQKKKKSSVYKILFGLCIIVILIIAATMYNKIQKQKRIENYLSEAIRYYNSESLSQAEEKYKNILSLDPDNYKAKQGLSNIKNKRKELVEDKKKRQQISNLLTTADKYFANGDLNKAKDKYKEVLDLNSDNFEAKKKLTKVNLLIENHMVFVKVGTFQMGSKTGRCDEKPVHTVTVNNFYISKYEVTQKEWKEVMGNNPSNYKGDNFPQENVSWYDAVEFCNKKSLKEGLIPCYSGSGKNITCNFNENGYRLPTEAEWEYAARGGVKSNGYKYSGSNNVEEVAWYIEWYGEESSNKRIHQIGKKNPNELGIYDMSGNLCEWCNDWYDEDYYENSPTNNPKGPSSSGLRVLRGGSWSYYGGWCRVANRARTGPNRSNISFGFRYVRIP